MRTASIFLGTAVVGGIAFSVPSIVLHAIRGDRKLAGVKIGLLINFNVTKLKDGIKRFVF